MSNTPVTLAQWLTNIEQKHIKSIDLGLERIASVWKRLALSFTCPVITVGGTNGKGSTCAMLSSIYQAAGYRVACHTSPHLVSFNERAKLNGEMLSDDILVNAFEAIEAIRGDTPLTYFEFTALAIFKCFIDLQPDVVILEVGLGGRLDAINLIDSDCAIVTNVDLDHQDYLGSTREAIGYEKAHIYRSNRPAICADPFPPKTLLEYAKQINADIRCFGRDFNYAGDKQQWSFAGRHSRRHALAYPSLRGANQLLNASGVLAVVEALEEKLPITQQAVREGLLQAELPGRFQLLPGRPTIILDVAHNPHAASVLAQNLDQIGFAHTTYAIVGMLKDKDIENTLRPLIGKVDYWHCVSLTGERAAQGTQIADTLTCLLEKTSEKTRQISIHDTPEKAFDAIYPTLKENDRMVVFGSFLTVASIMQHLKR